MTKPICPYCDRHPSEIEEYIEGAESIDSTPDHYVATMEGTYNSENGHFACTTCYIAIGMPIAPEGWVAP